MLALILAPLLLLAPVWLTGKALFWGTPATQFVPWWHLAYQLLRQGQVPLWNPLLGMGAPFLANYQSALFYPPNWLYFLFAALGGTPGIAWGQAILIAAHLAWAGLGMALLARQIGLGTLAQVVSGLAFGLSGYLVARSSFLSINAAAAWLPWVILGVTRLCEADPYPISLIHIGKKTVAMIALSIVISLQLLAGHAQTAWYTLLLAGIWAGYWAIAKRSTMHSQTVPLKNAVQRLGLAWFWLALAIVVGLALAAVQLLPTAEYLLQSQRAGAVDYEYAMAYSFWPWRFLTLLAPGLFGSPASGDYWGYANYWEDTVYIGLLPLLLAFGAIFFKAKWTENQPIKQPVLVRFLVGVCIFSFLLALGKNTPVFPWLYRHIPTFDMFQAPARYTIWAVFALSLLAGIGVDRWHRPSGRGLYWLRLGIAGAVAVALGAGATAMAARQIGNVEPSLIRAAALAGFWGVGAGILTLLAPTSRHEESQSAGLSKWGWAVIFWVAADLIVASWGILPGIDLDFYKNPSPTAQEVQSALGSRRLYLSPEEEARIKFQRFFRFDTFNALAPGEKWESLRASLLPNINLLDNIASVNNFDPLLPERYTVWMRALQDSRPDSQQHMLDLMAVSVVENVDASQPYGIRFTPRQSLPRLRWAPCAIQSSDPAEVLKQISDRSINLEEVVILEVSQPSHIPECRRDSQATLNLQEDHPNWSRLEVEGTAGGYLVIADVWYPGWRVRIDGHPTALLRANYLFRAVEIPEGKHIVDIAYQPVSFYAGGLVSGLAWLSLVLIFLALKFKFPRIRNEKQTWGDK